MSQRAAPLAQPSVVHTLDIEADCGKGFRFQSKRFDLEIPSGLPKVESDSVQNLNEVASKHRSVACSVTVVAEGTQDQAAMKRALDAVQRGLTVLEHN
jgi:hypothetical protein